MDSFFSQSSSWRSQSHFHRVSRRLYSQATFMPMQSGGVMRTIWTIIGLNTAVFGAWQYAQINKDAKLQRQLFENATISEGNIQSGRGYTMITSAFSHRDFGHFLFNMVSFHAFGSILSLVPGVSAGKVMALAIGSAAAGSFGWLYHSRSRQPQGSGIWSRFGSGRQITRQIHVGLGASGMVMGMGAAAACLMPTAPMNLMFIPVAIPLWVVTGLYFGVDAYYLNSDSKVGHSAHLGGAMFGAAFSLGLLRNHGGVWKMLRYALRR